MVTDFVLRRASSAMPGSAATTGVAMAAAIALVLLLPVRTAGATPAFATATGQSCGFCHTRESIITNQFLLNNQGVAFRNNGFRLAPRQPVCTMQKMPLYDRNGVGRGVFDVRVCN
jgi:hypothetical protein